MTPTLLIAEDAADVAEVVAFSARLNWPDCQVRVARDGTEALHLFGQQEPDLVVLDVSMPPPDGFELCRRIREVSQVPILMLTVRNATADKVRALDLGADDYLTKPFDPLELLARLRALLRRSSQERDAAPSDRFTAGDLVLDVAVQEVRLRGEVVLLTSTEYRLLEELVRHAGAVVPHQVLLERVWGPERRNDVQSLKVFVRRLRRKLGGDADSRRYIRTEWGIGYRFLPPR
ncbi:MAG: response regulator transcription factor [Chloroflexota bacterium]|nr:response regulator transcription factor [Chloroflexota bacterium]